MGGSSFLKYGVYCLQNLGEASQTLCFFIGVEVTDLVLYLEAVSWHAPDHLTPDNVPDGQAPKTLHPQKHLCLTKTSPCHIVLIRLA